MVFPSNMQWNTHLALLFHKQMCLFNLPAFFGAQGFCLIVCAEVASASKGISEPTLASLCTESPET